MSASTRPRRVVSDPVANSRASTIASEPCGSAGTQSSSILAMPWLVTPTLEVSPRCQPATGITDGSPTQSTRNAVWDRWVATKSSAWSRPTGAIFHLPSAALPTVGSTDTTSAHVATTVATCAAPKRKVGRSASTAAAPQAVEKARATAAGARNTSGAGVGIPNQSCCPNHTTPKHAPATVHARTPHANRHDRPMNNGSAAATRNA